MKVVEIKEKSTKKMNGNEYIEAGTYIQVPRYLTIKKNPFLQSVVHPIWTSDYTPIVPWPVPSYLMWILGIPEKMEKVEYDLSGIGEIEKQELRHGQKEVWGSIKEAMINGERYRKMVIAPMGTGKTWLICNLCWLFTHPLVVTKPSTFVEVEKQCRKIGVKCPEMTSYESLKKIAWQPDAIFFDECDKVKNVWSERSQKAMEIGEKASLILAASATPLWARVAKDIQVLNSITGKEVVPSNSFAFDSMFGTKFEEKEHKAGEFHRECLAYDTDRIADVVSSYVISLGDDEMMNEVLPIRYEKVYCEKPVQYDACKRGDYTKKSKSKAYSQCRMITGGGIYLDDGKYIQTKVNPKIDKLVELVEQQKDGCIIDVYFTEELPIIVEKLKAYNPVAIESGMSMEKQREVFRKIESGESKILVKSASLAEGLNLQDAFHVMIRYSIGTSPIKLKQSEGRIYRPGQKKEPIIIDLLCSDTEDERVLALVQSHVEDTEDMIEKLLMDTFWESKMKDTKVIVWGVANITINTYIRLRGDRTFHPFAFLESQRKQKEQDSFGCYLYDGLILEEMEALKVIFSKNIEMIEENLREDRKEAKKGQLLPLLQKDSHNGISFQELWDSGYICAGTTTKRGNKTSAIKLVREKIEALRGLELRALPNMIVAFDDMTVLKFNTTVNVKKIIDCRNERK